MKLRYEGILIFIFLSLVVSGCFNEDNPATCEYQITISGLSNYSSTNATIVLIPAPMMNGQPIFTNQALQNLRIDGWNASIINTDFGGMISFQTNNKNLMDINIHYPYDTLSKAISESNDSHMNKSIIVKNLLASYPLRPMIQKINTNDGFAENISANNYTSYVFLNKDLMPKNGNNTIMFKLRLLISEGRTRSQFGNLSALDVEKNIRDERGWIPVKVQYINVYTIET